MFKPNIQPILASIALAMVPAAFSAEKGVRNDLIYAPAPVAKSAIDMDGLGFLVNGERTFLSSGSIHYPRVPRALWEDRLLRMKQGSFNTVETYAFWNLHEPAEGQFDFTGEKDIGVFFDTAKKLGLYGIARVGPYVCAEWDSGGWPLWLRSRPDVVVRSDNRPFLELNDRWYEKILSIVVPRQINRGGNIVLVQLENEHPLGWGKVETPYFQHLSKKAVELGVEVPHFMSGLNHGFSPRPPSGDMSDRSNPWFTTEFWSGWFDAYGPTERGKTRGIESNQWMIMANGGGGQNFYMVHGGSNFESWNDPSGASSYDYGAPIGQAGELRPLYYRIKRGNQLAQSFPQILANGADVSSEYKNLVKGARVSGARRSNAGTIVFVTNEKLSEQTVEFSNGTKQQAMPKETFPVLFDTAITDSITLAESTARVLGLARNGKTTTLVVHGKPGDVGRMIFQSTTPLTVAGTDPLFAVQPVKDQRQTIDITFPDQTVGELSLTSGDQTLRIVAVSRDIGLSTWIAGEPGRQFVVCGPAFVRSVEEKNGRCSLVIERPYGQPAPGRVVVFGEHRHDLAAEGNPALDSAPAPTLTQWRQATPREAQKDYDDSSWLRSEKPQEMGVDNDYSAFAWYRARFETPEEVTGTLAFQAMDHAALYINGKLVPPSARGGMGSREYRVTFQPGSNTIAILTSHIGRNKCFNYVKPLTDFYSKGVVSDVVFQANRKKEEIRSWAMRGGLRPLESELTWTEGKPEKPTGAPVFLKARFSAPPPGETGAYPIYRATFKGLTRGTMWLNGHNLGRYPERVRVNSVYLPECWLRPEGNELVIFDEEGASEVSLVVDPASSRELIAVSNPASSQAPIITLAEDPPKDLPALNQGNLAFLAPASASDAKAEEPASNATDGDVDTSWVAAKPDPGSWLSVDFGKPQSIASCELDWAGKAIAFKYTLESSLDGQTWTKIGDPSTAVPSSLDSPSNLSRLIFPEPVQARHIRVSTPPRIDGKGTWPALREIRAYGL